MNAEAGINQLKRSNTNTFLSLHIHMTLGVMKSTLGGSVSAEKQRTNYELE